MDSVRISHWDQNGDDQNGIQTLLNRIHLDYYSRIKSKIQEHLVFNPNDTIYIVTKPTFLSNYWEIIWNSVSSVGFNPKYDRFGNFQSFEINHINKYLSNDVIEYLKQWGMIEDFAAKCNLDFLDCEVVDIERVILANGIITSKDLICTTTCILGELEDIYIREHETGVIDLTK